MLHGSEHSSHECHTQAMEIVMRSKMICAGMQLSSTLNEYTLAHEKPLHLLHQLHSAARPAAAVNTCHASRACALYNSTLVHTITTHAEAGIHRQHNLPAMIAS